MSSAARNMNLKRRHSITDATGSASRPEKRLCQDLRLKTSTLQLVESGYEPDNKYATGSTNVCASFEKSIASLVVKGTDSLTFTISGKVVPALNGGSYRTSLKFDIFTRNL